jgi:membrane protein
MKKRMQHVVALTKQTLEEWQEDKVSRLAAALAFYSVLSIPSILTLTVFISGQVIGPRVAQRFILEQAGELIGNEGRGAIEIILDAASQPEGFELATVVSICLLLFSASGVFVQLKDAFDTVWDLDSLPDGGVLEIIKKRTFSFAIVLAIGVVLIVLLVANSLVSGFAKTLEDLFPGTFGWVHIIGFVTFFCYLHLTYRISLQGDSGCKDCLA